MKKRTVHSNYIRRLADTLTPVAMYLNLRDQFPNALLLEASDYHSKSDSLSFICLEPMAEFQASGKQIKGFDTACESHLEVWEHFEEFVNSFEAAPSDLPFNTAGLFGYTSFEGVQYVEDINFEEKSAAHKSHPDLRYQLFRYVLVIDHFKNELYVVKHDFELVSENDPDLQRVFSLLSRNRVSQFSFQAEGGTTSSLSDTDYAAMVEQGIRHCQLGDVFQVVLSREFQQSFTGDEFNVYRSLRSINPSPYLFYFDYGDYKIFGSSPEAQIIVKADEAIITPIAGTVRRTGEDEADAQLAAQLQDDPKEKAEHIMLVDLARNDLSRNAEKVEVRRFAELQYFSHVIHMVSKVHGSVQAPEQGLQIYADTFPAGTLSGAPKYRAMQIIDELEPVPRAFYGGALGFLGFDGTVNQAIVIRSFLSKNNQLIFQAGAGVVVASSPEGEVQEVYNKIAALQKAIKQAQTL
jgi:anthranilate synthase component 1